ncbi:hypothetical protein A1Q2_05585 [Trichosporon asahii var. asahii CBS 8904]|uniref:F-box domain-containing protein n=1 Tax=Trichosporon asahii var. asahii (strain CBS 8904) TaxID=1220162 RepID=K1VLG2_TRIAC|nr:hypothetical protein A1Q2_05585 [Trichosporon asahii var. asahii CBS 8904]
MLTRDKTRKKAYAASVRCIHLGGSMVGLGPWDWVTLLSFFPNLTKVTCVCFEIDFKSISRKPADMLNRTLTITSMDRALLGDLQTISQSGWGLMSRLKVDAYWPPPSDFPRDCNGHPQIPEMFFMPLDVLHLPNFWINELWLVILRYRKAAGIPLSLLHWRLGQNAADMGSVAAVVPPGLRILILDSACDYPIDWMLDAITTSLDSRSFPSLEVLVLNILFSAGVTDNVNPLDQMRWFGEGDWASVTLPPTLRIVLNLTIFDMHDDPRTDDGYYEEQMLQSLPLSWLRKMRQRLGSENRITVTTTRDDDMRTFPLATPDIATSLQQILHAGSDS